MSVDASVLFAAQEAHRAGKAAEAEAGYMQWLKSYPNEANGPHFLGLLKFQTERRDEGVQMVREALRYDASNAHAWIRIPSTRARRNPLNHVHARP